MIAKFFVFPTQPIIAKRLAMFFVVQMGRTVGGEMRNQ
jgi:hypothetical protein